MRKQQAQKHRETLEQQSLQTALARQQDELERRQFIKPHFGPEDPDPSAQAVERRAKLLERKAMVAGQMQDNARQREVDRQQEQRLDEQQRQVNSLVLSEENILEQAHRRQQQARLKEAWD